MDPPGRHTGHITLVTGHTGHTARDPVYTYGNPRTAIGTGVPRVREPRQPPWTTWVTPLMICCTAIAESIMPASRVTRTTPPSLITRMISSE